MQLDLKGDLVVEDLGNADGRSEIDVRFLIHDMECRVGIYQQKALALLAALRRMAKVRVERGFGLAGLVPGSGLAADQLKAARGADVFKANCAACHGSDGKGNTAMGAPNLTDKVWLYGGSEATIIETVTKGRNGRMPAHETILTPEKVHLLTAYIWGLSNVKDKAAK